MRCLATSGIRPEVGRHRELATRSLVVDEKVDSGAPIMVGAAAGFRGSWPWASRACFGASQPAARHRCGVALRCR